MANLSAIVLAAGKGTRMNSPLPKVLHPVAGKPMIERVIRAVSNCGASEVRAVVGHAENLLRQVLEPMGIVCCKQEEQRGTADAVASADPLSMTDDILIMNGDHPMVTGGQLKKCYQTFLESKAELAVVTAELENPASYGRIVRHQGQIKAIVELKDASAQTKEIKEINTGIYFVKKAIIEAYLPKIQPHNKQNEFYFTDMVSLCIEDGIKVEAIVGDPSMSFGVNNQKELALASKAIYRQKAFQLMNDGVVIIDPENVYIEDDVSIGQGSILYPGCFIKGDTQLGPFNVVEMNCFIQDSQTGPSVQIRGNSYLEKTVVGEQAIIGPFARLRPDTEIGKEARVGNFVEMKKVKFGAGSKANHLTYLGDAEVGENTNIGCGTITCNYTPDKKKYKTKIGKNVFVGSDTQLVAPVEVGDDSIVASGTTVNKDVPAGALAIARARQENKEGYAKKFTGKK